MKLETKRNATRPFSPSRLKPSHHKRCISSQLHGGAFHCCSCLLQQLLPHRRRPRKRYLPHMQVTRKNAPNLRHQISRRRDDVYHPARPPGLLPQPCQGQSSQRSIFRWKEQVRAGKGCCMTYGIKALRFHTGLRQSHTYARVDPAAGRLSLMNFAAGCERVLPRIAPIQKIVNPYLAWLRYVAKQTPLSQNVT